MSDIIILQENSPDIGFTSRKPTIGPEWELVQHFLNLKLEQINSSKNKKTNYAIFIEPLLDTGFPDIVIAEYNPKSFEQWNVIRSSLKVVDLKVFHYLLKGSGSDSESIEYMLGISGRSLLSSLERLLDAGLILRRTKQWKARDLRRTLGVRKLIAIEAKIGNWSEALYQAQLNKWFSSESYVLTDTVNPTQRTINRSQQMGIGIYALKNNDIKQLSYSPIQSFPACFGSLLFNEWIGRFLNQ